MPSWIPADRNPHISITLTEIEERSPEDGYTVKRGRVAVKGREGDIAIYHDGSCLVHPACLEQRAITYASEKSNWNYIKREAYRTGHYPCWPD